MPQAADGSHTSDLVVLGGGSGGYAAAFRASELGLSVTLIEKDKLGGTCLHRGCIPTKALLHAAEIADTARNGAKFGVRTTLESIDMPGVHNYKDKVVGGLYKGVQGLFKQHQIEVVAATGRLVSPTAVEANGIRYEGRHILLATGSEPRTLPGLRLDGERIITSDDALVLDRVPESVIILGGGVIGVEFASLWRSFGAEVTIVEALPRLLPTEDVNSSKLLERAFLRRGITSRTDVRFAGATRTENGVVVSLEDGTAIDAELLLVAVGRGPVSEGLGYEQAGVTLDRGCVVVDEFYHTSVPTISAVGDLIPTLQLAHAGFGEGILVAERLAGLAVSPIDYAGVPRITYSEPEVASVGYTEEQAEQKYGADSIESFVLNLAGIGKAQILGTSGATKVIRRKDGPVIGIHIVATRAGELLAEGQLIYNWEAYPEDVAPLIHPHPTLSEAIGEAHLALAGKPLHVHP